MDIASEKNLAQLVLSMRDQFHIENFVETGTYTGITTCWASRHFHQVYTIERSERIFQATRESLMDLTNVEFFLGDSPVELKRVLQHIKTPALFWLDAHWSGGSTYGEGDECPLAGELEKINESQLNHFILIDDAHLFLSPPPSPHRADQWPDLASVIRLLETKDHPRHIIVWENVLIAVPQEGKSFMVTYCQAMNTRLWTRELDRSKRISQRILAKFSKWINEENSTLC